MLYHVPKARPSLHRALLRVLVLFDGRRRRRRQVEQDLLSLSPYLRRDIGYPW